MQVSRIFCLVGQNYSGTKDPTAVEVRCLCLSQAQRWQQCKSACIGHVSKANPDNHVPLIQVLQLPEQNYLIKNMSIELFQLHSLLYSSSYSNELCANHKHSIDMQACSVPVRSWCDKQIAWITGNMWHACRQHIVALGCKQCAS